MELFICPTPDSFVFPRMRTIWLYHSPFLFLIWPLTPHNVPFKICIINHNIRVFPIQFCFFGPYLDSSLLLHTLFAAASGSTALITLYIFCIFCSIVDFSNVGTISSIVMLLHPLNEQFPSMFTPIIICHTAELIQSHHSINIFRAFSPFSFLPAPSFLIMNGITRCCNENFDNI